MSDSVRDQLRLYTNSLARIVVSDSEFSIFKYDDVDSSANNQSSMDLRQVLHNQVYNQVLTTSYDYMRDFIKAVYGLNKLPRRNSVF